MFTHFDARTARLLTETVHGYKREYDLQALPFGLNAPMNMSAHMRTSAMISPLLSLGDTFWSTAPSDLSFILVPCRVNKFKQFNLKSNTAFLSNWTVNVANNVIVPDERTASGWMVVPKGCVVKNNLNYQATIVSQFVAESASQVYLQPEDDNLLEQLHEYAIVYMPVLNSCGSVEFDPYTPRENNFTLYSSFCDETIAVCHNLTMETYEIPTSPDPFSIPIARSYGSLAAGPLPMVVFPIDSSIEANAELAIVWRIEGNMAIQFDNSVTGYSSLFPDGASALNACATYAVLLIDGVVEQVGPIYGWSGSLGNYNTNLLAIDDPGENFSTFIYNNGTDDFGFNFNCCSEFGIDYDTLFYASDKTVLSNASAGTACLTEEDPDANYPDLPQPERPPYTPSVFDPPPGDFPGGSYPDTDSTPNRPNDPGDSPFDPQPPGDSEPVFGIGGDDGDAFTFAVPDGVTPAFPESKQGGYWLRLSGSGSCTQTPSESWVLLNAGTAGYDYGVSVEGAVLGLCNIDVIGLNVVSEKAEGIVWFENNATKLGSISILGTGGVGSFPTCNCSSVFASLFL